MTEARTIVARLLVALALIVQIVAPVRASVSMVETATDPLAIGGICGHDRPSNETSLPAVDACRLCDLVCHGDGFASVPPAPSADVPAARVLDVVRASAAVDVGDIARLTGFSARAPPKTV